MIHLSRRAALTRFVAAAAAFAALPRQAAAAAPAADEGVIPITLAQWSLNRTIFNGDLDPLDFPLAARRFGITGVEYVNQFYQSLPRDGAWSAELAKRCRGEGVRSHLIMCDGEGDLGDPSAAARRDAVDRHRRWLEIAAALGCHSIRVNARSSGTPTEQHGYLVEGLGALCDAATPLGLSVLVENHGGQSSDGEWLAAVLRGVGRPNMGALPDFGNFRKTATEWADRYVGVRALAPLARAMSAKSYDFDASGAETTIDYPRMLAIARAAGYRGAIGIEYEGKRLSEEQGIRATKRLLERLGCRAEASPG